VLLDDDDDVDDDSNHCLPNAIVNHGYDVEAPSFRTSFIYTTDQKWTVSLLKILDKANAPDYVFGDILEWGRSASAQNYSFNPVGGLSHSKNIDSLINSVWNGNKLLPFVAGLSNLMDHHLMYYALISSTVAEFVAKSNHNDSRKPVD
jgi:hypothetical protein